MEIGNAETNCPEQEILGYAIINDIFEILFLSFFLRHSPERAQIALRQICSILEVLFI